MSAAPLPPAKRLLRVGVIVDSAFSYGRGVTEGIISYAVTVGWRLHRHIVTIWSNEDVLPEMEVDGVIAMVFSDRLAERLKRWNVPVVNVASAKSRELPSVVIDNQACGRMAALHFLERGFLQLGVVYSDSLRVMYERYEGFIEVANERGIPVKHFSEPLPAMDHNCTVEQVRAGLAALRDWVGRLPSPIGVYCIGDTPGTAVIDAAHDVGRHVPEEIAVLGTDDDLLTANSTLPPLSSVQVPSFAVGVEAAKMLERLMAGRRDGITNVRLPPPGITVRASSEILAISDPDLVLALRYIRDNVAHGIGVEDVLRVVPLSRRPLERKFRKQLDRSILNEIHRSRIDRAKTLLASTDLSITNVATKCGFKNTNHFGTVFRQFVGSSPNRYKNDFGGAAIRQPAGPA